MHVGIVATPELGDRTYLIHDGRHAVVVDPQRDTDRVVAMADQAGVEIVLVLETHIHNDYVTGGLQLARDTGARYGVNALDRLAFSREPVSDRDLLTAGSLQVEVIATPGHTDTHLAYAISNGAISHGSTTDRALFTGGSLLYGSVGRTDLIDPARTRELTHAQYRSARTLAELPDATAVYPTHGFGSFCSAGSATGGDASTIALERMRNDALTATDEHEFVERLISGLTAYPSYYTHMAPLNRLGPLAPDLALPAALDGDELAARLAAGEWVVDVRDRALYAADHILGTVCIPLGDQFSTYLGWLAPWGRPITLVTATPTDIARAQVQLSRIGIDALAGAVVDTGMATGTRADPLPRSGFDRVTFAEVPFPLPPGDRILDVRRDDERAQGGIEGSLHIPLAELESRVDELPPATLWVHCRSGFRAATAASILERAGRRVVHIDDDYASAALAGHALAA